VTRSPKGRESGWKRIALRSNARNPERSRQHNLWRPNHGDWDAEPARAEAGERQAAKHALAWRLVSRICMTSSQYGPSFSSSARATSPTRPTATVHTWSTQRHQSMDASSGPQVGASTRAQTRGRPGTQHGKTAQHEPTHTSPNPATSSTGEKRCTKREGCTHVDLLGVLQAGEHERLEGHHVLLEGRAHLCGKAIRNHSNQSTIEQRTVKVHREGRQETGGRRNRRKAKAEPRQTQKAHAASRGAGTTQQTQNAGAICGIKAETRGDWAKEERQGKRGHVRPASAPIAMSASSCTVALLLLSTARYRTQDERPNQPEVVAAGTWVEKKWERGTAAADKQGTHAKSCRGTQTANNWTTRSQHAGSSEPQEQAKAYRRAAAS
jgi:hypothetical protein